MQPALTDRAIAEAQRLLDVTLPESLLDLLRHRNGGEVADEWSAFPVLDAEGITFADSSFLGLLLATHQQADLRIAAPSATLARLLSVVGADAVLRIHPTVQDALAAA